jgi:hypothetical protein
MMRPDPTDRGEGRPTRVGGDGKVDDHGAGAHTVHGDAVRCDAQRGRHILPGRKPPFWAIKRPARPGKNAIETRFTMEHAKGA